MIGPSVFPDTRTDFEIAEFSVFPDSQALKIAGFSKF